MFKNIVKIFSSHIIVKLVGLLNVTLALYFLSVKDFGKYSYYLVLLHLVSIIIDPFLSSYLIDYKLNNYKKYNIGIFIFPLLLLPFFYILVKGFIPEVELEIFILFCLSFILSGVIKSFLNVNEFFFKYGLVDVFRQFSIFLGTLFCFFILKEYNYLSLLRYNYVLSLLSMLLLLPFFITKRKIYIDIKFGYLKTFFLNSRFLIFYTAIIPFVTIIDSFFVDKYLNESDLGLYSFSLKVYNISLLLVVPIFTVLNIEQIEIAKENNYWQFFKRNIKKVTIFSFALFSGAILLNFVITQYFFIAYKDSFVDTNILLCASFITYLSMPFSFLLAYRRYKWLLFLAIVAISVNIGVNYFFIAKYGTWVAAVSTLLTQLIINLGAAILSYILLHKKE